MLSVLKRERDETRRADFEALSKLVHVSLNLNLPALNLQSPAWAFESTERFIDKQIFKTLVRCRVSVMACNVLCWRVELLELLL